MEPRGRLIAQGADGAVVVAEGEQTGHRHAIFDAVTFFRDDGLARDIPSNLYIGHIKVPSRGAELRHDEHGTMALGSGTYRVRRQRQAGPLDVHLVTD